MNYEETLNYIDAAGLLGSKPGLSRISELCCKLGNPQDKVRFVHVAGTNGKGSVCAMLSEILISAGLKTGLFTSPHLCFFEERIRINGEPIQKERLAEIIGKISRRAEEMSDKPTEFEIATAAAFLYFAEENCDIAVLETGLGGRLDSTNIIKKPLLSVITGIALDHTAVLGDTVEKIAAEKAGIIKSGRPAVIADCPAAAKEVLMEKAKSEGCEIIFADEKRIKDKTFSLSGTRFTAKPYGEISLSLAGINQLGNAAVAIAAAESLKKSGVPLTEENIKKGLAGTVWQARFELLSKSPAIIYDGAHNPQGAEALAENVKILCGGRAILAMGVMADKEYSAMVKTLAPYALCVFTVTPDNPRALGADALAEEFVKSGVKAHPFNTVAAGVTAAINAAKRENLPLIICGSLYMYSDAADAVKKALS